jgi:hypothetical protein
VIDTRDKRASVMGFARPYVFGGAQADGTIDKADRPALVSLYSGIDLAELLFFAGRPVMALIRRASIMRLTARDIITRLI